MTARALALVLGLVGILLSSPGAAHERSSSHASVRLDGADARIQLSVSARELDGLLGALSPTVAGAARSREYVTTRLHVTAGRGPCPIRPGSAHALSAPAGRAAWEWTVGCPPGTTQATLESHLFEEIAPRHLVFVRIAEGTEVVTDVLTEGHRAVALGFSSLAGSSGTWTYMRLGVAHILSGYDHLAFLVALLVLAASFRGVARVVTGFTVGHSATLALAALGWIHPDSRLVEAAIGVSIAVVAAENVWAHAGYRGIAVPGATVIALLVVAALEVARFPRAAWALAGTALAVACYFSLVRRSSAPDSLRGAIASAFGLVHGLGFAASFAEHPVPTGHLVGALLGFNVGVELGQLAVGASVWWALHAVLMWRPSARAWVAPVASAAVCGAGVYWTVMRLG